MINRTSTRGETHRRLRNLLLRSSPGYRAGVSESVRVAVAFRWNEAGSVALDSEGKLTLSLSSEKRINALLTRLVAEGGRASLAIATTATIEINGVSSPLDLTKKASRLLAENAALVEAA